MTPDFQIIADDQDVTATIAPRLISLTITDEDGRSADRLKLVIDDRDNAIEMPQTDVQLDVWLGFKEQPLTYMGRFAVDTLSGSGMPRKMIVGATAANMASGMRAPKTRGWTDQTLAQIVQTIAGEAGLAPVIDAALAGVHYPFIAQTGESDLNLLTRLAHPLDATAKPAGGALVVVTRDSGLTAAGDAIVPVDMPLSRLSRWKWDITERETYAAVEAQWGDVDAAATNTATAGRGDPVRRMRNTYATQAEAQRAADAELAMAGRQRMKIDCDIAGFEPALFASGIAQISGIRAQIDGRWLLKRVVHQLSTTLSTTFTAQRAKQ